MNNRNVGTKIIVWLIQKRCTLIYKYIIEFVYELDKLVLITQ